MFLNNINVLVREKTNYCYLQYNSMKIYKIYWIYVKCEWCNYIINKKKNGIIHIFLSNLQLKILYENFVFDKCICKMTFFMHTGNR